MSEPRKQYRHVIFIVGPNRPYPALLRTINSENVACLELLGGPRDGEIVRDVVHDRFAETRFSWHDPGHGR